MCQQLIGWKIMKLKNTSLFILDNKYIIIIIIIIMNVPQVFGSYS
jgi:hypothetical protein